MSAGAWPGKRNTPMVASVAVLALVAVGLGLAYVQSSTVAGNLSSQLSDTKSQLSSAQGKISTLSGNVSSLQSIVSADTVKLASDQTQASLMQSTINTDTKQIANLTAQAASFQSNATAYRSSIATLQGQVTSLTSQMSALQTQISALQSQITTLNGIAALSSSTVELSKVAESESAGGLKQISQFTASYAGYLVVSGNATTQNSYIALDTVYPSQIQGQAGQSVNFVWGANGNFVTIIPIIPGTIVAYLGNYDTSGTDKATITLTYYY